MKNGKKRFKKTKFEAYLQKLKREENLILMKIKCMKNLPTNKRNDRLETIYIKLEQKMHF